MLSFGGVGPGRGFLMALEQLWCPLNPRAFPVTWGDTLALGGGLQPPQWASPMFCVPPIGDQRTLLVFG